MVRMLQYLWALPNTLLGLMLGLGVIARGGKWDVVDGVIEFHGRAMADVARVLSARGLSVSPMAMTLGHVVIGTSASCLEFSRPHERVHVRQYARWGPFFLPAYLLSSLWNWSRGRNWYHDNAFEREAYAVAGHGSSDCLQRNK